MKKIYILLAITVNYGAALAQLGNTIQLASTNLDQQTFITIDYEGDGDMDIITCDGLPQGWGNAQVAVSSVAQTFYLIENDGGGTFSSQSLLSLTEPLFWCFGDINGDDLVDFFYASIYTGPSGSTLDIHCRMNLGGGTFASPQLVYSQPDYDDIWEWDFWLERITVGDYDTDGDNELLFLNNGEYGDPDSFVDRERINVIEYSGGTFSPHTFLFDTDYLYGGMFGPWDIADFFITDFNTDGLNDIMYYRSAGDGYNMGVFYATAPGVFLPSTPSLSYSYSYDIADMIGDGELTLISVDANIAYIEASDTAVFGSATILSPYYEYFDAVAAGIVGLDLWGDVDGDIVMARTNGQLALFENDETWNTGLPLETIDYTFFETGILETVSMIDRLDFDGDGDEDVLLLAEGILYAVENNASVDNFATLDVNVFVDENLNNTQDMGEISFNNFSFQLTPDGGNTSIYNSTSGPISLNLMPNDYEIGMADNFGAFNISSALPIAVNLPDASSAEVVNIALVPDGTPSTVADIYLEATAGICNGTTNHFLWLNNVGALNATGTFIYALDAHHTFINSTPAPSLIAGNTYSYEFSEVAPGGNFFITLNVTSGLTADLGESVVNTLTVELEDGMGNIDFTDIAQANYTITCSYDPNDITEHNGYTDQGYILAGDELDYTIRFQNTGNAPAQDVRIENQLPAEHDWSTMQPIAWSHDFQLMIDETGRAIFTFDEINLPDSVNNEAESHGFVRYRINSNADLIAGEIIENTAEIFFDLNPAVVTNTEVNTIYDCADLEQGFVSSLEACIGNDIVCTNYADWLETMTWYYNDQFVATGSFAHTVEENGTMVMQATNGLCEVEQQWSIVANETTASFTQNGNTLMANAATSYQWYLNGNEIANATSQTFVITQTGNYSVMTTGGNGCSDLSDVLLATYTGIEEMSASQISIYPNPASDFVTITISNDLIGNEIVITDMLGKTVMNAIKLTSRNTVVDCSILNGGVYEIQIGDLNERWIKQ